MARIRSIHPKMWCDEKFVELSKESALGIIALGTFCDYADRFVWDADAIAAHCGGQWILQCLDELLAQKMITREGDRGEVLFSYGFSRRRISRWESLRSAVFERDGYACVYCGVEAVTLHCDHIMPVSRGGCDDVENLATACERCNCSKGDKTLEEWRRNK